MNGQITFSENLTDFLTWVKLTTEAAWTKTSAKTALYGAKWLGLSEYEIEA